MNVYTLIVVDTRADPADPDLYVSVYQNKEDAIRAGIEYANFYDFDFTDEEKYNVLNAGNDLKRGAIHILPICERPVQ